MAAASGSPVLVTLGVRANGERVVLDLRLAGEESAASWREVVTSLVARHLTRPVLAVVDGVKTDGPSPEITDLRCPLFSDDLVH